ncbi:MAG TPA: hypothetical protein VFR23_07535 [Jiangellaceae bacterium]|nr:hypothetical protein [Jiangellaceae bacterium]
MHKPALALAIGLLAGLVAAPVAAANPSENAECFGVVSSQRAVADHDIGQHASEQEEPRLGLGNVTRLILGDDAKMGDFGAFLGEIDGIPETSCP